MQLRDLLQVDDSKDVAGIYCLTGDQMEMFDDLKKRLFEPVRESNMFGYENYNSSPEHNESAVRFHRNDEPRGENHTFIEVIW